MKFSLLDGKEGGEHTDVGFVELSKIFEMHDAIFFEQNHLTELTKLHEHTAVIEQANIVMLQRAKHSIGAEHLPCS